MGKNSFIKTLGKGIGNVVLHKLLIEHTNKPESKSHLQYEELAYRDAVIKNAKEYNWNEEDNDAIKIQAIGFIKDKMSSKYNDVNFPLNEAEKLIEEEIKNLKL